MQDFRSRLVKRPMQPDAVQRLLEEGHIAKALRQARSIGVNIPQELIDRAAEKMLRQHRATELLSLIGTSGVRLPYDAVTLLQASFEARDYHGFLKQAHRLGLKAELQVPIEHAIKAIELRAPIEADSWRRKFAAM